VQGYSNIQSHLMSHTESRSGSRKYAHITPLLASASSM
jgi:hypothetical protein